MTYNGVEESDESSGVRDSINNDLEKVRVEEVKGICGVGKKYRALICVDGKGIKAAAAACHEKGNEYYLVTKDCHSC